MNPTTVRFLGGAVQVILLTALLLPADAVAQYFGRQKVQYEDFDFKKTQTDHYSIYFYPAEDVAVQDAARMAERWYFRHARTFRHQYEEKPLIFYANDVDFQQTNVIEGMIGQGTGGVTEALQNRVVMPLTGIYRETDHVLGHELVHTFQYDIVQSPGGGGLRGISGVPLWLVEGMAEFLTLGRDDPHTAMWIRDAVLQDDVPTIEQLTTDVRYFPYRYGQAYMAFIEGRYGDRAAAELFRLATTMPLDSAIATITGVDSETVSELFRQSVRSYYLPLMEGRTLPEAVGRDVISEEMDGGRMNVAPAVSPDGRYVAFLSERNLFEIELFLADTQTGEVIEDLAESSSNPHYDAIRFINSAGTWSPDGRRFAFVVASDGDNEIAILDVTSEEIVRRIAVEGVGAFANPSWSPDGRSIAFSGIHGGISDLFIYDMETGDVRQLTNDRYADIQPDWSPDGTTLAFVTDRGPNGSNFETLSYVPMRLGFIDVATADIIDVVAPFQYAEHINPQYAPDGRSLFFLSNREGFKDIYRMDVQTGDLFQVTNIATGVSGITDLSPALSVAEGSGLVMFSVFEDGNYNIHALTLEEAEGTPVVDETTGVALAGLLPPAEAFERGLVGEYLHDPTTGLPETGPELATDYNPNLRLVYVGQPTVGVGYDTQFGAGVAGGISFFFSDILGNHLLGASVQASGTFKDIGAQVLYFNRENQLNYGAQVSHTPYLTGGTIFRPQTEEGFPAYDQILNRIFLTGGKGMAQYPLSTTRRLEAQAGYTRVSFDQDIVRLFLNPNTGRPVGRDEIDGVSREGLNMLHISAAYVGDYSYFGFTSPVRGGRYRLELGYQAGSFDYGTLLADYRRYFFERPFTFAFSAYHYGRYGSGAGDFNVGYYPLNVGYSMYNVRGVHGYGINSFDVEECANDDMGNCAVLDRVIGTRVAVAATEARLQLFGTRDFGLINLPYLPTELVGFFDAGLAWTADRAPDFTFATDDRKSNNIPVFSTGVAARMNLLGYLVFELFYAHPFQRPDKDWVFGFTLMPGW